jgi:Tfp pilus assembly protein PilZ
VPPKRKQKRTPRRFNVRFRKVGEEDFAVGYTKNVSAGGLFVGTIRPFPPGTEIEVEIREAGELRHRPAVVVHAARVSPLLASVRTSGMGVRFRDRVEAVESGEECEMLGEGEPPGTETEEAVGRFGEEKDGTELSGGISNMVSSLRRLLASSR